MRRTRKEWSQVLGGVAMLITWLVVTIVGICGTTDAGKILAYLALIIVIAVWNITGVGFIAKGLKRGLGFYKQTYKKGDANDEETEIKET